jgi:hypothetical protein
LADLYYYNTGGFIFLSIAIGFFEPPVELGVFIIQSGIPRGENYGEFSYTLFILLAIIFII